jgi:cytochrome o ubiquinol oxidase subunit 2
MGARGRSIVCQLSVLAPLASLGGCGWIHAPVLDPKGPVALAGRDLLLTASGLMLIVLIPVYVLTIWIIRTYSARSPTDKAGYMPDWSYSIWIDVVIWAVPALIVAVLGYLVWARTHTLDPYRELVSDRPPLEVHVVAQDWKWLFIYPEEGIATVNDLVFPSGRPLSLRITSDTVMNSFYIAGLGGQIYAMAGMETRLNLLADEPVELRGRNTQYSGRGFADQHFAANATTEAGFEAWVAKVRRSPGRLDAQSYATLAKPSTKVAPLYYSAVAANLFAGIIAKYRGAVSHADHSAIPTQPTAAGSD